MDEEELSYEMLQDLLRTERRSNKPTPLPPRFWSDIRGFLDELVATFRTEQAKDPFGRRTMLLTDEVKNARHAAKSLWALRERKLAMLALAHTDDRQRPQGITPDERALYDRYLQVLGEFREKALGAAGTPEAVTRPTRSGKPAESTQAKAGTAPAASDQNAAVPETEPAAGVPVAASVPASPAAPDSRAEARVAAAGERADEAPARDAQPETAADAGGDAAPIAVSEPPSAPEAAQTTPPLPAPVVPSDIEGRDDLVTIRALGDIPAFVGPDMQTYRLKEGDVATVPPSIAGLLERRKKAVVIAA